MAIYKCKVCGAIYDEEKEGKPVSELTGCPVCKLPVSNLELVSEENVSPAPAPGSYTGSLNYDSATYRQDPSCRYMEEIHEMAVTGKSLGGSMSTQMPIPNWDDILLLGAQLNPPPLNDGDPVDTTTVIGKHAKKPMVLDSPIYISHMSFGALSKEVKVALAKGSAMAKTAMCSGEGGILPEEKHKTAAHEAGHAIVQKLVGSPDPVHQISVIPSGRALGYTLSFPEKDKRSVYKNELLDNICMLLGGRAAEQLVNGDISGGASNDMERATEIARNMVTKLGMSDVLGPVVYSSENNEVFLGKDFGTTKNYSEKIAELIDDEIEKIIKGQFERALKILGDNRDIVEFIADYLVKHEIMDGEQFELCFRDGVTEADLDAVSERKANRNSKENEERRAELEKAKSERKRKTPRADDDSGKDDIFSDDVFKE